MAFADALRAAIELIASDRRLLPRPSSQPAPDQIAPGAELAERSALAFFRTKRKATVRQVWRVLLFALTAAGVLVWFLPATRTTVRATWHRATAQARRAIVAATSSRARAP
jgi:hypothetical protein